MRNTNILAALCALGLAAGPTVAATSLSVSHDGSPLGFDGQISLVDLANGLIAHEKVSGDGLYTSLEYVNGVGSPVNDQGWHSANPASGDALHPNGLPTLTNGLGAQGPVDGLLNDFPGDGMPTKRLVFDLGGTFDIGQINILGGNANEPDGRVFITTVIRVSTDGGTTWTDLDGNGGSVIYDAEPFINNVLDLIDGNPFAMPNGSYFQSDPTLTLNNSVLNVWQSTFMEISDDASPILAAGVTHVNIEFYAVHHNDDTIEDPFLGVNPFTGINDNITSAGAADFNEDQVIDLEDFNALALNFGTLVGATLADGDADGDEDVDGDDFILLQALFGNVGGQRLSNTEGPWPIASPEIWEIDIIEAVVPPPAVVPEPATIVLFGLAGAALLRRRA